MPSAAYQREWIARHLDKRLVYQRRYRVRDPERAKRLRIASSARYRAKKKADPEIYHCYRERQNKSQRKHKATLRAEVFTAYGNRCACCGFSDTRFLTIDHINNNGSQERKTLGVGCGMEFYRVIKRRGFPVDYQLLCANCNCAKGWYGICPHRMN